LFPTFEIPTFLQLAGVSPSSILAGTDCLLDTKGVGIFLPFRSAAATAALNFM